MTNILRVAVVLALSATMTLGRPAFGQANTAFDYYAIESFTGSSVRLQRYHTQSQTISTATISPYVRLSPLAGDLLKTLPSKTIIELGDLDDFIVRNGLGEVVGDGAPARLVEMETLARDRRIGMWARLPQPDPVVRDPTPRPEPKPDPVPEPVLIALAWKLVQYWKELVALGLVGGVLGFLIRYVYRRIWVQRRVVMSVIGLKGSGKSSVLKRFNNRHLTEDIIAKSSPTIAREQLPSRGPVPVGRYEVVAELNDNPGDDWGAFFQALATRRRVGVNIALLVLAPTDEVDATSANWRKDEYIQEQIGFAKGLIGGCLQARKISKPQLIIIYLNKFDLVSDQGPEDSASRAKVTEFRQVFKALLDQKFVTDNDGQGSAPIVRVIVGSALKDWGNKEIRLAIEDALYSGSR
jgi:GTPase SAR1 family protein